MGSESIWISSHLPEGPQNNTVRQLLHLRDSKAKLVQAVAVPDAFVKALLCSNTFCIPKLRRYLFQDPASRLWWSGSFKHVYRAPQHAYQRWLAPAAPRSLPVTAAQSFASAPLLTAQPAAPAASRTQRLQAAAREGLRALRARAYEPGLGLGAAEQHWHGRLASGAEAGQRAMQWLRRKRQAYQLVLAHPVAAL